MRPASPNLFVTVAGVFAEDGATDKAGVRRTGTKLQIALIALSAMELRRTGFCHDDDHAVGATFRKKFILLFERSPVEFFGHICPVFFVAEPLTETADRRKATQKIQRCDALKSLGAMGRFVKNVISRSRMTR